MPRAIEVDVTAEHLDVFDRPDDRGFITGRVGRGDHLRVRLDQPVGTGWLAIDPLPTSILWVQESSLELEDDGAAGAITNAAGPGAKDRGRLVRAWVSQEPAIVRSGSLLARLPGPPKGTLPAGTLVQLVDRPAAGTGTGREEGPLAGDRAPAGASFFHSCRRHPLAGAGRAWSRACRGSGLVRGAGSLPRTGDLSWQESDRHLIELASRGLGRDRPPGWDLPADRFQPADRAVAFRDRPGRLPEPAQTRRRSCRPGKRP